MNTSDVVELSNVRAAVMSGKAREVRQAANISQAEAARAIGVSAAAVSRWECGRRLPTGPHALRYARLLAALGLS